MSDNNAAEKATYSVPALLESAGLAGAQELKKRLGVMVQVYGKVQNLKLYPHKTFFALAGGGTKIQASIPSEFSLAEGQPLVINGVLSLKPSRFQTGLDVILEGLPVEGLSIAAPEESVVQPIADKDRYLPIATFLDNHPAHTLLLIGSETGIKDCLSRTPSHSFPTNIVRISQRTEVLAALAHHLDSGDYSAIAIMRGGDDNTMDMWDDPAFVAEVSELFTQYETSLYVALGHAHRRCLIERYADQAFPTPSAFGDSLQGHIVQREETEKLRNQNLLVIADSRKLVSRLKTYITVLSVVLVVVLMTVFSLTT